MDEVWARIGLVLGAMAVAGVVVAIQRRGSRMPEREIEVTSLAPGLYFFSSSACSTCGDARIKISVAVGEEGFTEFVWEEEPGVFADLEVTAVPALLVVAAGGSGRLYPGQPDKALASR